MVINELCNTGAVQIAGGQHHSLVRLSNGTVMSWGRGDYGQLGIGERRALQYLQVLSAAYNQRLPQVHWKEATRSEYYLKSATP